MRLGQCVKMCLPRFGKIIDSERGESVLASSLLKSISDRYEPVRIPVGPITIWCRSKQTANWFAVQEVKQSCLPWDNHHENTPI